MSVKSLVFGESEGEEDVEDGVDGVGGQVVHEEAEDAVVEHAVLEGAVGRPEWKVISYLSINICRNDY